MKNNSRACLLHEIQMLSFTLTDLNLYLDTHPKCSKALEMFCKTQAAWQQAVQEYSKCFGPIVQTQMQINEKWDWNQGPLPWDYEFMEGGNCSCGRM